MACVQGPAKCFSLRFIYGGHAHLISQVAVKRTLWPTDNHLNGGWCQSSCVRVRDALRTDDPECIFVLTASQPVMWNNFAFSKATWRVLLFHLTLSSKARHVRVLNDNKPIIGHRLKHQFHFFHLVLCQNFDLGYTRQSRPFDNLRLWPVQPVTLLLHLAEHVHILKLLSFFALSHPVKQLLSWLPTSVTCLA